MAFIPDQMGKVADDLRVFEVAALGDSGHSQMLFHQPDDQVCIAGRQS